MKKLSCYAVCAAVSILALVSCAKEKLVDNSNGKELHFVVKTTESAPVKSYIAFDGKDTYTPSWHKGDAIAIFTDAIVSETGVSGTLTNENVNGSKASFAGEVAAVEMGVFKAIYPAGRVTKGLSPNDGAECVGVNLGDPDNGYVQNPVAGSFDPLCDILISKPTSYMSNGTSVVVDDVYFKRVISVIKVVLKGSAAQGQKVSNFKMTTGAEGVTLSGRAKIDVTNATVDSWTVKNAFVKAAFAENNEPVINEDNNAFFIVVNPVTLPKDSKLTISAETASHYINKDITLPKDIVFPEGQMAVLNITINEGNLRAKTAESPKYILVKDVKEITAGSEVIIVADGSDYALGTTQNTNNRAAVSITKSNDKSSIDNISSDVQVFTVQKGTKDNTVAFYTGQGYIYAASSSENHLKTQDNLDDNASWTISITSEGVATITAQGANTNNILKKNGNSALFSCYSSGQSAVSIYKYSITALGQPANLKAILNAEEKTITVTWDSVDNAESYKVTCGDDTKPTQETSYVFTVPEDGLYEISVVATTSDASFKDSAPATTTVRVGAVKKSKAFFSVNGQNSEGTEYEEGTTISFPSDPSIEGVEFMGWTRSVIPTPQAAAPDFVNTKSTVMGAEDITFYAVFATKIDGGISWVKKSLSQIDSEGVYALLTTDGHAFNGTISSSGHGEVTSSAFSFTDNIATSAPEGICELTFIANGTGYKMYNASKGYLYAKASSSGNLEWHKSETSYWSNKSSNWTYESNNAYLRSYNNTFRTYGTNNGAVLFFAQKITKIIFTDYCTNVVPLSSISVSGTPNKTEYTVGEAFDPDGLTVTGTYSNGESSTITEGISWSWTPATFEESGNKSVSVTATVKSIKPAVYNVNVIVNTIPNTLAATDKSIDVNAGLDVTSLFTTNSDAAITYTLDENPSGAGTLSGKTFSATAKGPYKIKASQAETTKYSAAEATAIITVNAIQLSTPANLKCSEKTETSLTFTWDADTKASGYQVSLDGGKYEDVQTEMTAPTYTWDGLTEGTSYTLYVKAIGDKTAYTDSKAVSVTAKTLSAGGGEPTVQTIFLETFGDNGSNNTALDSYTKYSATASMFTDPSSSVGSHYSSAGKVGKNSVNVSNYDGASGKSAVWIQAIANTTSNVFTVEKIDISGATDITISFGLFYSDGDIGTKSTVKAYYTLDDNTEQVLDFTQPTAVKKWSLCSSKISGTGSSLKIRFELKVTGGYTVRIDDVKVVGTK